MAGRDTDGRDVRFTTNRMCFLSDRVKCRIYSFKETALWLISRMSQHVDSFELANLSTKLAWNVQGKTMQYLSSHSATAKDLNHPAIWDVFRDNRNVPLLTLRSPGRTWINIFIRTSISPLLFIVVFRLVPPPDRKFQKYSTSS